MSVDDETLVALAAVGALDDEERRAFDARVESDPELAAAYAKALEAAALLGDAVTEPPPPHLRASVLAAIADAEQLPPDPLAATPTPSDRRPTRQRARETTPTSSTSPRGAHIAGAGCCRPPRPPPSCW